MADSGPESYSSGVGRATQYADAAWKEAERVNKAEKELMYLLEYRFGKPYLGNFTTGVAKFVRLGQDDREIKADGAVLITATWKNHGKERVAYVNNKELSDQGAREHFGAAAERSRWLGYAIYTHLNLPEYLDTLLAGISADVIPLRSEAGRQATEQVILAPTG